MPPIDIKSLECLCLIEEGLVNLEMLVLYGLLRKEKFGSGRIALLELLCEDLVDGQRTAMVLHLLGNTVE